MKNTTPIFRFKRIQEEDPGITEIFHDRYQGSHSSITSDAGDISSRYDECINLCDMDSLSGSSSLTITNCTNCRISLNRPLGTLHMYNLKDCTILFHAVIGSVNIGQSIQCNISGFCSQLRISDAENIVVHVQTRSRTALVNCRDIYIGAPPPVNDPIWQHSLTTARMNMGEYIESDLWRGIDDFALIQTTTSNWRFIDN